MKGMLMITMLMRETLNGRRLAGGRLAGNRPGLGMMALAVAMLALATLAWATPASAQNWRATNGPAGASVMGIAAIDTTVIALVEPGVIFTHEPAAGWQRQARLAAGALTAARGRVFATGHDGLFRSSNRGRAWQAVGPAGRQARIAVDGDALYLAVDSTIHRSNDGGEAWTTVCTPGMDFHAFSVHGPVILLGRGGDTSGVFRSANGGTTWQRVTTGLPAGAAPQALYRDNERFYATFDGQGVFRSDDGGITWAAMNNGIERINGAFPPIMAMIGARGTLVIGTTAGPYAYSETRWLRLGLRDTRALAASGGSVYAGSRNGVEVSADSTWTFASLNAGLLAQRADVMASFRDAVLVAMGGAIHRTDNQGRSWSTMALIDARRFAVTANHIHALGSERGRHGVFHSVDGTDWGAMETAGLPFPQNWLNAIAVAGDTVYVGYNHITWGSGGEQWEYGGVYRTTNNGGAWQAMNAALPHDGHGHVPVLEMLAVPGAVLAYTRDGLYRTTDGGEFWTRVHPGIDGFPGPARMVAVDRRVYLAVLNAVYVSADSGLTWKDVRDGIPDTAYIHHLSTARGRVYISALVGEHPARVYRLDVDHWTDITAQFPEDVEFHTFIGAGGTMLAGTAWSGVWVGNPDAGAGAETPASAGGVTVAIAPNPIGGFGLFTITMPKATQARAVLYNTLGTAAAVIAEGAFNAGRTTVRWDRGQLPAGLYFLRLEPASGFTVTGFPAMGFPVVVR